MAPISGALLNSVTSSAATGKGGSRTSKEKKDNKSSSSSSSPKKSSSSGSSSKNSKSSSHRSSSSSSHHHSGSGSSRKRSSKRSSDESADKTSPSKRSRSGSDANSEERKAKHAAVMMKRIPKISSTNSAPNATNVPMGDTDDRLMSSPGMKAPGVEVKLGDDAQTGSSANQSKILIDSDRGEQRCGSIGRKGSCAGFTIYYRIFTRMY